MMESRFFLEAKVFSFFGRGRQTKILCGKEKRIFRVCLFESQGYGLVDRNDGRAVEVIYFSGLRQIHSEGIEALTVRRVGNKNGQFLVVSTQAVDDRRNVIVLPKGHEGRGWGRFAGELCKVKAFFKPQQCPSPTSVLFLGAPRPPRWHARLLSITCMSWT
jgi:hypothetical protein